MKAQKKRNDRGEEENTDEEQKAVFGGLGMDDEGNIVYKGSWTGPEPEVKILPSDSARFMTFEVTYDTDTQIVTCYIEEGGGIG